MAAAIAPAQQQSQRLTGLSASEVIRRRERGEGNAVEPVTSRSYWDIVARNTFTFIGILLFGIAIFLIVLGLYGDAVMTAALILLNIVVSVIQETRAKRQLDRIALLTRPQATVIRDGREQTIEPAEIVRGDLLVVRPGDQVLVDGRVVEEAGLSVDESLLTGESDLVPKALGDQLYSGSFCMTGSGCYQAEQVGAGSMAQKITDRARAKRDVRTPLQREIGLVIRVMVLLMLALGVLVGNSYWKVYHELPLEESVRAAAVIVALVPQGLVLMVAVTYAMAAVRMSGKGALIQRMNAVESTSHIGVLCLDKTGTLTTNRLRLHELEPLGIDEPQLRRLLAAYAATTPAGNRTIEAIAAGCGPAEPRSLREEVPFSSARKWSALAFEGDGVYVLGAPDMLAQSLCPDADLGERAEEWKSHGLRVLLFGRYPDGEALHDEHGEVSLPAGLIPLGTISFSDELRPEAQATITEFADTGITLKVISGDHPETVASLARQAGFPPDVRQVSGLELAQMDDAGLGAAARDATIFGRITPEQKERLIRALRAQGQYVAMIGDGVNDVLALKQAHLAIAMKSGSQVTRNVADIVLVNDSFAALPAAFREGQRILRGMQDVIQLFLVRAAYVALIIVITSLLGEAFPVTPKQNALLATLTVGIPAFFLAFWARPGTTPRSLVGSARYFVIPAASSITLVSITVYFFVRGLTPDLELARSALTTTTVFCGLLLIPFVEPPTEAWTGGDEISGDWRPTIMAVLLLAVYFAVILTEPVRHFYDIRTLPLSGYILLAFVVAGWAVALRFVWRLRIGVRLRATRRRLFRRLRRRTAAGEESDATHSPQ